MRHEVATCNFDILRRRNLMGDGFDLLRRPYAIIGTTDDQSWAGNTGVLLAEVNLG
jgi:hypothetical protein